MHQMVGLWDCQGCKNFALRYTAQVTPKQGQADTHQRVSKAAHCAKQCKGRAAKQSTEKLVRHALLEVAAPYSFTSSFLARRCPASHLLKASAEPHHQTLLASCALFKHGLHRRIHVFVCN